MSDDLLARANELVRINAALLVGDSETDKLISDLADALREAREVWTDENGLTWTPPTAWAYAMACKTRDKHSARVIQLLAERDRANELLQKAHEALGAYSDADLRDRIDAHLNGKE